MDDATRDRIRDLLSAGVRRSKIARQVGVSPSTVTRWARLLGFPDITPRPSQTDWRTVQEFYDLGHSITECKDRFGFTYGAWDKAVARRDLIPRRRNAGELGRSTRDDVENLISRGLTQADIARELGIAKSTVAFHMRGLGHRADPRFARRLDWQVIQAAIDEEGLNMAECLKRFGLGRDTWYRAVKRGDIVPNAPAIPLEQLLVAGRRRGRGHIKLRLLKAGLKEPRCDVCGIADWHGQPLSLHLHHVNGDGDDNRLENLELLCPNCHSQTETYGGRNGHRRKKAA